MSSTPNVTAQATSRGKSVNRREREEKETKHTIGAIILGHESIRVCWLENYLKSQECLLQLSHDLFGRRCCLEGEGRSSTYAPVPILVVG